MTGPHRPSGNPSTTDPGRAKRAEAWLDQLWDLPDDERAERLVELEKSAPEDAAAVCEWLNAIEESEGYLESSRSASQLQINAGERVGAWRLKQCIGQGGMGEVWLAERADNSFDKRVAIKFIRNDAAQLRQSLETERRLLAQLSHPRIARLLDGGVTASGMPFLVTEYIDGEPIHNWCEAHRPSLAKRLNLFRQVCDAVIYAHANLIVHRDIKPSNILVDRGGRIHLLDFGIARALRENGDAATLTANYGVTPDYAAPEQLTGARITTRTDVYALGVLLYLLTSGKRPLEMHHAPLAVLIKHICEDVPAPPSRGTDLPAPIVGISAADLDAIALKALAKSPDDRYVSAEALLADLDNAMAHRPIAARRMSRRHQSLRYLRRHWLRITLTSGVFLALACGLVGTLWQRNIANEQRDNARIRYREANAAIDFMSALFSNVATQDRSIAPADLFAQAEQRVLTMQASPEDRFFIANALSNIYLTSGKIADAQRLLERFLDRFGAELSPQPFAQMACALGYVFSKDGQLREAKHWYDAALDRLGNDPNKSYGCLAERAGLIYPLDRDPAGAIRAYRTALALAEEDAIRSGTWDNATYIELQFARTLMNMGRIEESLPHLKHAYGVLDRQRHGDDMQTVVVMQVAGILSDMAYLQRWAGMLLSADAQQQQADATFVTAGLDGSDAMVAQLTRGAAIKLDLADVAAAEKILDRIDAIMQAQHVATFPASRLVSVALLRGRLYAALGDNDRAQKEFANVTSLSSKIESRHAYLEYAILYQAEALLGNRCDADKERARAALSLLRDLPARLVYSDGSNDIMLARAILDVAEAALLGGDDELAAREASEARALYLKGAADPTSGNIARCDLVLGQVRVRKGDRATGVALITAAVAHLESSFGAQHPRTLRAQQLIGAVRNH